MCDGQDGARVGGQVLLQPQHRLGVEVVGGLVEQEQVGLAQQQLAQRDAAHLATGQVGDGRVARRATQCVHGLLDLGVHVPGVHRVELLLEPTHLLHELVGVVGGHLLGHRVVPADLHHGLAESVLDVLLDRLGLVEHGLLHEDADAGLRVEERLTVGGLVEAGHDLEDRGLARAVGPHHADLRTGIEGHRHVVEDHLVPVRLANLLHSVNKLGHFCPLTCANSSHRRGWTAGTTPMLRAHPQPR